MSDAANLFAFGVFRYDGVPCPVMAAFGDAPDGPDDKYGKVITAFDCAVKRMVINSRVRPVQSNSAVPPTSGTIRASDTKRALREANELLDGDAALEVLAELFPDEDNSHFLSPPGPGIESHRDKELQQETCPT